MGILTDGDQAAVRGAPPTLGDRLGDDCRRGVGGLMDHFGAGVLVLAFSSKSNRQCLTLCMGAHEVASRVFHIGFGTDIAVDPLHRAAFFDVSALGDEVVHVVRPVLDGRITAASVLFDDDLDDRGVQGIRLVDRGSAALDVVNVRALVDDNQGPLELSEILGIHTEVGLQRDGAVDTLRHVDEGATRPHRRVEGGELVVTERDSAGKMLAEELRLLLERSVSVEEDDTLLAELLVNLVVNHFRLVLGGNAGNQPILLSLRDTQTVVGVLNIGGKVLPGRCLTLLGTHEVLDLVKVNRADVNTPGRHRLALEKFESLETHIEHPLWLMFHSRYATHDILGQSAPGSRGVSVRVVPAIFVATQGSQVFVLTSAGAREACGSVNLGHEWSFRMDGLLDGSASARRVISTSTGTWVVHTPSPCAIVANR